MRIFSVLLSLCLICTPTTARAWNDRGHMSVAGVAWRYMNDQARARASALLRFAGERASLTGDGGEPASVKNTADPILSVIEFLSGSMALAARPSTTTAQAAEKVGNGTGVTAPSPKKPSAASSE